jgi:hypothetical protein
LDGWVKFFNDLCLGSAECLSVVERHCSDENESENKYQQVGTFINTLFKF